MKSKVISLRLVCPDNRFLTNQKLFLSDRSGLIVHRTFEELSPTLVRIFHDLPLQPFFLSRDLPRSLLSLVLILQVYIFPILIFLTYLILFSTWAIRWSVLLFILRISHRKYAVNPLNLIFFNYFSIIFRKSSSEIIGISSSFAFLFLPDVLVTSLLIR